MFSLKLINNNLKQSSKPLKLLIPTICQLRNRITEIKLLHKTSNNSDIMEFFDDSKNWGESTVKSGRGWRKEELRIKSNSDLHKLWFVLYKERNMLKTMEEAAKDENELFPSPERIDKVEQSMKNLEDVVRERNKAYWELEVGEGETGERKRVFRKDIFGRWRWIGCSEHIKPFWMNPKWRALNAPGFGKDVKDFNIKLNEKKLLHKKNLIFKQSYYCRQLLRRFPDLDIDYLQEKFPDVDVKYLKENLDELCANDRWRPFHRSLYD